MARPDTATRPGTPARPARSPATATPTASTTPTATGTPATTTPATPATATPATDAAAIAAAGTEPRTRTPADPGTGAKPATRPTRPHPDEPRTDRPRAGRQRRLVGVAIAAVVLAVLAALLVPYLLRDSGGSPDAGRPTPAPSPSPQPTDTTPSPQAAAPPPEGYQLYRDPAGWSVAVPTGWRPSRRGAATTFTDDGRTLKISYRAAPRDPYDDALKLEPVLRAATPGYDLSRIARVTYRGWPTADWQYRAGTSARTRTLTRTVVPNSTRAYTISWTTPESSFETDRAYFDTAMATFSPAR